MAKKKSIRTKVKSRLKAGEKQEEDAPTGTANLAPIMKDDGTSRSKHIARRVARQEKLLSKLKRTQVILSAGKSLTKRKGRRRSSTSFSATLESLSQSLGSALPSSETLAKQAKARAKTVRSKQLQKLVLTEAKQLAAVTAHPAFQANPFEAVRQHLENTMPPLPPPPKVAKKGKKGGKRKRKKSGTAEEDVEME